jgi:hypothetical protein
MTPAEADQFIIRCHRALASHRQELAFSGDPEGTLAAIKPLL